MVPMFRKEIASSSEAKNLKVMAFKSDDKEEMEKLCSAADVTFILKPAGGDDKFIETMQAAINSAK
jgi:hypothetical protein